MKPVHSTHPSMEQLYAFAQGTLEGEAFHAVASHVETCDACCTLLSEQPDNTLLELAREVATWGTEGSPEVLDGGSSSDLPAALMQHPRYAVFEMIGQGGMGAVYRAEHRMMQRTVALKVVHPRLLTHPQAVERFEREVRLAAKLSHPNIVVAYDADRANSLHFLVMEYVEGKTLDRWIAEHGPVDYRRASDWIRQAALGLQHAHERGMAHRDIKPQNLILTKEGQLRILDFGLSRLVTCSHDVLNSKESGKPDSAQTHADTVLGTPEYIAPEQIQRARDAGIRADIYGLGCTFFFLLTGKSPFQRSNVEATLNAQLHEALPDPRVVSPDVPAELVSLLNRMTTKRPEDRPSEPREVAERIAEILKLPNDESTTTIGQNKWSRRTLLVTVVAGFAVTGLLGLGAVATGIFGPHPVRLLVILPSHGLWFPDYRGLVEGAVLTGTELTFASPADHPSQVLSTSEPGSAVPDLKLSADVKATAYDGIVFVGYDTQEFSPDGVAGKDVGRLLNEFQMQKKIVASLCAGQRILAQHGALRGKVVTPAISVQDYEIEVEGGKRIERDVWVDGLVVTCADAAFAQAFLEAIKNLVNP